MSSPPPRLSSFPCPLLLPVPAKLHQLADPALLDEILHDLHARAVRGLVRDGALHVVLLARRDHLVGLLERLGGGLFEEDARAVLGAGKHHVAVAVGPAVRDGDDLRLFFFEHLLVVGVGALGAEPLGGRGAAGLVLVGDRDDFDLVGLEPDGVEAVAVVALTGAADHCDAVLRHERLRMRGAGA
jgi:hypothetical protein